MLRRLSACLILLAGVAGCATGDRLGAASDVRGLLISIRDDDRPAFEAHVDRAALEGEMQALIVERAKASGLGQTGAALGILASGPLAHAAGKVVLRPDVFRAIAEAYGYRPDQPIPGEFTLAAALKPIGEGRVCARDPKTGACLLTFAHEEGTWKLVAFDASRISPRPAGWR